MSSIKSTIEFTREMEKQLDRPIGEVAYANTIEKTKIHVTDWISAKNLQQILQSIINEIEEQGYTFKDIKTVAHNDVGLQKFLLIFN